jgi:amidase
MGNEPSRRDFLALTAASIGGATMVGRAEAAPADDFTYRSAADQVAALARREVSSAELLELSIARIEGMDSRINAVVVRDFDRAREAAKAADTALARGERRPLLGLPMTVKEGYRIAGLRTTWGLPAQKDFIAKEDALAIERLKAAGAVIFGKTNVPINLSDWQSYNEIYGTTNNPWNLGCTPGGSSGGSAAAVAAGYTALEMGSDIAGSLRAPAHYCGIFSHKPSQALVPARGHVPPGGTALPVDIDLAVIGPLARSAGDLALALDVVAGPDAPLARAYRLELPAPRAVSLKAFRVLVVTEHPRLPTAAAVRGPIERLAARLEALGAKVGRSAAGLPDLALGARIYTQLLLGFYGVDLAEPVYKGIAAQMASVPETIDTLDAWRGRGLVISHRDFARAGRIRESQRQQWRALFTEWDVVLAPPMPTSAFPHDHTPDQEARRIEIDGSSYPYLDQMVWPGVATLPGLPATTMPLERSADDLPVGVQIIGPFLEDRTTIEFARLAEREFGGFVAPPQR